MVVKKDGTIEYYAPKGQKTPDGLPNTVSEVIVTGRPLPPPTIGDRAGNLWSAFWGGVASILGAAGAGLGSLFRRVKETVD